LKFVDDDDDDDGVEKSGPVAEGGHEGKRS